MLQHLNVTVRRQRIPDAGNPGEQSFQSRRCLLCSSQVAESQLTARFEHAKKLLRCNRLTRKSAEGALADDRIQNFIAKRQPLCVTELKADLSCQTALRRSCRGQTNVLFAQINASDLEAEGLREMESAG